MYHVIEPVHSTAAWFFKLHIIAVLPNPNQTMNQNQNMLKLNK